MRIRHRISVDLKFERDFARAGVDLRSSGDWGTAHSDSVILRLYEDDPRWDEVERLIRRLKLLPQVDTEFSPQELDAAAHLRFMSTSFSAIAEPRNNFQALLDGSFDLSEYCSECGVGKKQVAPLRMAGEPKWGKRQSMQIRWFFDVLFVRRDTWNSVFLKFGVEAWPVLTPKGAELETIVQLKLQDQVPLQIPSESPKVVCRKCGRAKYHPIYRGFFPPPENATAPIFASLQEFGHEHASERALIVSQDLYQAMRGAKMNCQYWCCKD